MCAFASSGCVLVTFKSAKAALKYGRVHGCALAAAQEHYGSAGNRQSSNPYQCAHHTGSAAAGNGRFRLGCRLHQTKI